MRASYCLESHAFFRGNVTSKTVNNLHEYISVVLSRIFKLGTQKDINFLTGKSQEVVVV